MLDAAILPGLLGYAIVATAVLMRLGVPSALVTALAVASLAAIAAVLERVRPRDRGHVPLDQPLRVDALHFVFNYHAGYAIALLVCARVPGGSTWPGSWPTAAQVGLAVLVAEGVSYWQHRLAHRLAWLWRFHALHHAGARLNLVRAARFHGVDIGSAAFFGLAPLVLLGAPADVVTWTAVLGGALGVVQHTNLRAPTPRWLDRIVCTPIVHRFHHSRSVAESDANFGTFVMVFDVLFGTYRAPRGEAPAAFGVDDDGVRPGFLRQMFGPFTAAGSSARTGRRRP
jgi:ornithine lipid hydroxylase